MRGQPTNQPVLFHQLSYESIIPKGHPLVHLRKVVDQVLEEMSGTFEGMYAQVGRPSIPPECLIRALLIGVLYSVRSDRQLMERLEYDLLIKWFVGLSIEESGWSPTTFTKNRDRLLRHRVLREFFDKVLQEAHRRRLLSEKHFSVDGTLLQAWAGMKSFRPRSGGPVPEARQDDPDDDDHSAGGTGRNVEVDFRGQSLANETHESTTDPEALLARKGGKGASLCYLGHSLIENRNGLIVDACLTKATGTAECEQALEMAKQLPEGATLAADKGYDTKQVVTALRAQGIVPHIARNEHGRKRSLISHQDTADLGYQISQRRRKMVEEPFGWLKTVAGLRKLRWVGRELNELRYLLAMTAYNLIRMTKLEHRSGRVA